MPDSKAAKIWRRTWVGTSIAASVALLLWIADSDPSGYFLLFGGWILAALASFEAARLGAGRSLALKLAPALVFALIVGVLAVLDRGASTVRVELDAGRVVEPFRANLGAVYGCTLLLAVLAQALASFFSGSRRWLQLVGAALCLLLLATAIDLVARRELGLLPVLIGSGLFCFGFQCRIGDEARRLGVVCFFAVWIIPPLTWLHEIDAQWGMRGLVALLLLSKIGDTAGYFVGNAIGKSHPFPLLSPGKTTAGCVASLAAGMLAGAGCVAAGLLPPGSLGIVGGVLAGAAVNVAAQAGDLLESLVKRRTGVKDSGSWFGPSGGVLDLVDSLLLTVPMASVVFPLLFSNG